MKEIIVGIFLRLSILTYTIEIKGFVFTESLETFSFR